MPIIAKDRLSALVTDGKARMDKPGRFSISQPPQENKKLRVLQSMQTAIEKLADKEGGNRESTDLLKSIEALLRQLILLSAAPQAQPAARPKTNWQFQIKRDAKGRLMSVDAVPIPNEGD